jgi:hypothetical protein
MSTEQKLGSRKLCSKLFLVKSRCYHMSARVVLISSYTRIEVFHGEILSLVYWKVMPRG